VILISALFIFNAVFKRKRKEVTTSQIALGQANTCRRNMIKMEINIAKNFRQKK